MTNIASKNFAALNDIPDVKFKKDILKDAIYYCMDADFCFTNYDEKTPRTKYHVHFKNNLVTIDRLDKPQRLFKNYTMSKLEFVLYYPELMKVFEAAKRKRLKK